MSFTLRENITAVIETCFSETKDEIQEVAINKILELIRNDKADRKTENNSEKPNNCELQTIRCPKCGRTDYIRDMEKDMGIKGSRYKYKCINCNTYIKDEPQTEREGER